MRRRYPSPAIDMLSMLVFVVGLAGVAPVLDQLHQARHRREMLEDIAVQPAPVSVPIIAPALIERTNSKAAAEANLAGILRQIAVRESLLIESCHASRETPDGVVSIEFILSGDVTHILRFAESVENRATLIRFSAWHLAAPGHGDSARISATAASLWTKMP